VERTESRLRNALVKKNDELTDKAHAPRALRVRAVLDTLTVSTRAVVLRLDSGRVLHGFAQTVPLERLKALLGADVIVEGVVAFGPSDETVDVEVEGIFATEAGDSTYASLPVAVAPTGLDGVFGKWPGDETDAQLSEALQSMS
jgi:hypothetical protein